MSFDDIGNLDQRRNSILKAFRIDNDFEKARSGTYSDTAQNRRLNRVGQKYGTPGKDDEKKDRKSGSEDAKGKGTKGGVDYSKMHNTELNAAYKKKFGVDSTAGINRAEMEQAMKSGKPVQSADGGKGKLDWRTHLSEDPDKKKAQLAGMMDRVLNASIAADNKGDKKKGDELMNVYNEMRSEMNGDNEKKEQGGEDEMVSGLKESIADLSKKLVKLQNQGKGPGNQKVIDIMDKLYQAQDMLEGLTKK